MRGVHAVALILCVAAITVCQADVVGEFNALQTRDVPTPTVAPQNPPDDAETPPYDDALLVTPLGPIDPDNSLTTPIGPVDPDKDPGPPSIPPWKGSEDSSGSKVLLVATPIGPADPDDKGIPPIPPWKADDKPAPEDAQAPQTEPYVDGQTYPSAPASEQPPAEEPAPVGTTPADSFSQDTDSKQAPAPINAPIIGSVVKVSSDTTQEKPPATVEVAPAPTTVEAAPMEGTPEKASESILKKSTNQNVNVNVKQPANLVEGGVALDLNAINPTTPPPALDQVASANMNAKQPSHFEQKARGGAPSATTPHSGLANAAFDLLSAARCVADTCETGDADTCDRRCDCAWNGIRCLQTIRRSIEGGAVETVNMCQELAENDKCHESDHRDSQEGCNAFCSCVWTGKWCAQVQRTHATVIRAGESVPVRKAACKQQEDSLTCGQQSHCSWVPGHGCLTRQMKMFGGH